MAIFNRFLDIFNGDMGPVKPRRFQAPMSQPYVDDMFDPLFNRKVVEYNRGLYGALGAVPAGYAQMWENALTGREGILGPGMGILSTFGRSMDKADDFILGGLTEGVNAIGSVTGTNDAPTNPIRNIFVEDRDYEGSDLLAAMGNAMGKLAGGARLDRGDFQSLPDRLQASVVNLATDPGFMGGNIARANPANRVAKALDDYDNAMAAIAGNMALPGAKAAAQSGLRGLINLVGGTMNAPLRDYNFTDDADAAYQIRDMMTSYADVGGTDHLTDAEYAVYRSFVPDGGFAMPDMSNDVKYTFVHSADDMLKAFEDGQLDSYRTMMSPDAMRFGDVIRQPDELWQQASPDIQLDDVTDSVLSDMVSQSLRDIESNKAGLFDSQAAMQDFIDRYYEQTSPGKYEMRKGVDRNVAAVDLLDLAVDDDGIRRRLAKAIDYDQSSPRKRGSAYLTVSDADFKRKTAQHYAAVRESLFQDAASKLSKGSRRGASNPEEAVANAFSQYTRNVVDASAKSNANAVTLYANSTGHTLRHILRDTLRQPSDDGSLPFKIMDTYNRMRGESSNAYSAMLESFRSNYVFNKSMRDFDMPTVVADYRQLANSLGAGLPDSAGMDDVAKWFSDNRAFVNLVRKTMSQPSEDIQYSLEGILSGDVSGISKKTASSVVSWLKHAQANKADVNASKLNGMPTEYVDQVHSKSQALIEDWYSKKRTVDAQRNALERLMYSAADSRKADIQAQLSDIDALDSFVKKLERLELAASTTTPRYLRDIYDAEGVDYPVTIKDVLFQGSTSEYIGDDMKSMMDWLDANPSQGRDSPLSWQLRPGRKVLANDFGSDGRQIRPEGRLLTALVKPWTLSESEWRSVLHHTHSDKEAFAPTTRQGILKYAYLQPGKVGLEADGAKAYSGYSEDMIPLVVPSPKYRNGYMYNPEITPDMMRSGRVVFVGDRADLNTAFEVRDDGLYVGPAAFNYFTRHPDYHGRIEYKTALDKATGAPLASYTPEETAKLATEPPKMGDAELYSLSEGLTAPIAAKFDVPYLDPLDPDDITFIKRVGSPKDQTLFAYLNRMVVKSRNAKVSPKETSTGFLNRRTKQVIERAKQAMSKYPQSDVYEYIRQRDAASDAVVPAKDFVGSLVNSEGFKVAIVKGDESSKLLKVVTSNVNKVNEAVGEDVLKVVYKPGEVSGGADFVGYAFNGSDKKIKRHLNEYAKRFDGEGLGLQDVVFHKGTGTVGAGLRLDMVEELNSIFDDTTSLLNEYTERLGFTPFDKNYVRHDLVDDVSNDFGFVKHKQALGVMESKDVAAALSDIREFDQRMHRTLGTRAFDRSWYGDLGYYGTGFSHDLENIVQSTFTKGALDNANANLAQELFFNDNFSLKRNFASPNQLMDALRQEGSSNMANLQIVVPKMKDGVLVGFTRVDAYDDAGILRAYDNDNAVLVPKSIFGKLDRVLRKEAKMGNSMYRFAQKYLTVPFKLGVISNLGFLFGNVQDASFKQVESFMRRYDTSFDDECFNAAASYRHAMDLQNRFSDVIDRYVDFLGGDVDGVEYKHALASVKKTGTVDAALITSNPHYLHEFAEWLKSQPDDVVDQARLYLFAHKIMDAGTFENNYLDLEDLAQAGNKSAANEYDIPLNAADRVLYGDRSKGERSFEHGPFKGKGLVKPGIVTNPVTGMILKPSNVWEHTTRLATVINYMRHEGWTDERIANTLGNPFADKALQKLHIDMLQGVDMMNHANFDYDDVTEFMDKVSYAVPFPTFYLKNIAHWMETFVDHPQMIDDIISYQEGLWQNKDVKGDEFAAEAKGRGAYPLGGRTKLGTGIVKQSPVNSMFSAFSAFNNFQEDFAYRTHPMVRPLTRHLQKQEDVKYRPYSTDPYEKNIRKGDREFSELSYMFHQLNPYERYVNTYLRTPKKVATNDYQASDFLPSVFQPDFGKKSR